MIDFFDKSKPLFSKFLTAKRIFGARKRDPIVSALHKLGSPRFPDLKDGHTLSETLFGKQSEKIVFASHKLGSPRVPRTFFKYGMKYTFSKMGTPFATRKN